jgi:hypothetical protein
MPDCWRSSEALWHNFHGAIWQGLVGKQAVSTRLHVPMYRIDTSARYAELA